MKRTLIITGGEFCDYIPDDEYDLIIACDKGYEYANQLNIEPDIIIGDFDSADESKARGLTKALKTEILTYPVEKDDTDTMLAIKEAIKRGTTSITIVCALGNRLDHTIANVQSIHYAVLRGVMCELVSKNERLAGYAGPATFEISKKNQYSLSLFALSDECTGVSISGAKYCVDDVKLTNSFPLGLGNQIKDDKAIISIKTGEILVVESYCEEG